MTFLRVVRVLAIVNLPYLLFPPEIAAASQFLAVLTLILILRIEADERRGRGKVQR